MTEVRAVTPRDAETWAGFRHALWPDATLDELTAQVRAFFKTGIPLIAAAFLAWNGDEPVGFIELSVRAYVPGADSTSAPFVEGWFVVPEYRGKRVGRMLVRAAEKWARDNGHTQLGSDVQLENEDSAKAHEALGFREVETIRSFIKDLGDAV